MSRYFLVLIVCLMHYCANGQQVVQKMFWSQYLDNPNRIIEAANGDFLFINYPISANSYYATTLTRTDSALNILWNKEYVVPGYLVFFPYIKEIAPDTLIVWGGINDSISTQLINTFLLKIDGNGTVISAKILQDLNNFYIHDIIWSDVQQKMVLYGKKVITGFYDERMQILTYDKDLNYLWGKEYTYGFQDDIISADFFSNNGLILQADVNHYIDSSSTEPCCGTLLIHIDSTGNELWTKRIGNIPNLYSGNGSIHAGEILVLDNHEIVNVYHTTYYNNSPKNDIVVQKVDSLGNEINSLRISNATNNIHSCQQIIKNQNLILRLNNFTNFILDQNLNYIDFKRIVPSNNQITILDQQICTNGQTVVLGQYMPSKKISVMLTDSMSNIGCNQYPFIPCPYQTVSMPNTGAYYPLNSTSLTVLDSTVAISASGNWNLQDSLLCLSSTVVSDIIFDEIKVFPTMTYNKVFIESSLNNHFMAEIYNAVGQKLEYFASLPEMVDLSHLPKGVLILRIKSKSYIKSFKLIHL